MSDEGLREEPLQESADDDSPAFDSVDALIAVGETIAAAIHDLADAVREGGRSPAAALGPTPLPPSPVPMMPVPYQEPPTVQPHPHPEELTERIRAATASRFEEKRAMKESARGDDVDELLPGESPEAGEPTATETVIGER